MDWTAIFGKLKTSPDNSEMGALFSTIEKLAGGRSVAEIKRITGWAGLLGRVAYADLELAPEEISGIRKVLEQVHDLDEESARQVVELLEKERAQLLSIEDYIYSRLLNEVASRQEKVELLGALFRVAAADGTVAEREEAAIRLVAHSLLLDHADFIAARLLVRDQVPALRRRTEDS
jgi:uncharacterized tellurite resistance protein B-like protein